jgi:hypothetical protein
MCVKEAVTHVELRIFEIVQRCRLCTRLCSASALCHKQQFRLRFCVRCAFPACSHVSMLLFRVEGFTGYVYGCKEMDCKIVSKVSLRHADQMA